MKLEIVSCQYCAGDHTLRSQGDRKFSPDALKLVLAMS